MKHNIKVISTHHIITFFYLHEDKKETRADLEVQLVQLNHCDGVLVITLKTPY